MERVVMTIMSNISDAQELMAMGKLKEANYHLNFVKWLSQKHVGTTRHDIEADAAEFESKFGTKWS
jgi:DNA-dependent RNA polymerase auxiliary subunit epsilon